jgi:LPS export ABC transporter protein LptC
MSINVFFLLVLTLLLGMFSYFKPINSIQEKGAEVPQFELDQFVIYEISPSRIDHFFEGEHGKRFSDRYEATGAKFTNNERTLLESIQSRSALYKDDIVSLKGDVRYIRADGLQFHSNEGVYNQKESFVKTDGAFTITKNQNSVHGIRLHYDLSSDTVLADQVRGSYQLN